MFAITAHRRGAGERLRSGVLAHAIARSDRRPRSDESDGCGADQRFSGATLAAFGDGGSSEAPNGSCARGAACGARIWKGRSRCSGDGVVKLRPAARKAKRRAVAAMKLVLMSGPIIEPSPLTKMSWPLTATIRSVGMWSCAWVTQTG